MIAAERYRSTSTLLFDQAIVELENGDLIQASEKFWGAAAQALKSIAESRGWRHYSHAHFYNIVADLVRETGDLEIRRGFDSASHLHANFYENQMEESEIRERIPSVRRFVDTLAKMH